MKLIIFIKVISILIINFITIIRSDFSFISNSQYVLSKLSLSVDLAKLDLFPAKEDLFKKNGFKDKIFNITCLDPNKYSREKLNDKLNECFKFGLYDYISFKEINEVNKFRYIIEDEEVYKKKNVENLIDLNPNLEENIIIRDLNLSESIYLGAFKLSNNYNRLKLMKLINSKFPEESRIEIKSFKLNLDNLKKMKLSRAFHNAIYELKDSYEEDIEGYESFISVFGTHFFSELQFGGLSKIDFRIIQNSDNINLNKIENKDEFDNNKPFDHEINVTRLITDENFGVDQIYFNLNNVIYKKTSSLYGGVFNKKNFTLDEWINTVSSNSWLIEGKLRPLSALITSKEKKKSFIKAINDYLKKAEILNLKDTIDEIIANDELNKINSIKVSNYLKKINSINRKPTVENENLVNLSKSIQNFINTEIIEEVYNKNQIKNFLFDFNNLIYLSNSKKSTSSKVKGILVYKFIFILYFSIICLIKKANLFL